jgi:hypothetical protein
LQWIRNANTMISRLLGWIWKESFRWTHIAMGYPMVYHNALGFRGWYFYYI